MAYIKTEYEKQCKHCGKTFKTTNSTKLYCDTWCLRKETRNKYEKAFMFKGQRDIHRTTLGAINEYRVCVDLLMKGYEIFKSITPNCSCDLIMLKDNKIKRIEVTSGYRVNGKIYANKHNKSKYDIMVIVVNNEILYEGLDI